MPSERAMDMSRECPRCHYCTLAACVCATPPASADGLVENVNVRRAVMASTNLGKWMSAALDDHAVCDAMKADIQEWFSAGEPVQLIAQALTQMETSRGE